VKTTLLEALVVAVLGALVAFAANALSPRGLKLSENYFPGAARAGLLPSSGTNSALAKPGAHPPSPAETLAARLLQEGLSVIETPEVIRLFREPGYDQEQIVFIDARKEEDYQAGHVPGAYQFDRFQLAKYMPAVYPICQQAQQVVVYCHGGDCEDSIFAAVLLRDAGMAKEKLFVYGGGWTEWETNGVPVELGERRSGNLRPTTQ
jgi:rhodanese-related sulfurtransferase